MVCDQDHRLQDQESGHEGEGIVKCFLSREKGIVRLG